MKSDERFLQILDRIRSTHQKKGEDYGNAEDPFANISAAEEFGMEPWVGTVLRMNDKMARIKSFIKKGVLQNESLSDSLLDIAVYAIIALVKYEEKLGNNIVVNSSNDSISRGRCDTLISKDVVEVLKTQIILGGDPN